MKERTQHKLKPSVLQFCRSIVPDQEPFYVSVQPLFGQSEDECFVIVPKHISTHGGKQVIGWYIEEWPKVMIEATFHAIWQTEDGRFVDITPKGGISRILFLPDTHRKYEGRQIDNIRKPLTEDKIIYRFCELAHDLFTLENKGDLAYESEITITDAMEEIKREMYSLYLMLVRKYGVKMFGKTYGTAF
jgi:hypothetical protein